jgi:hypothetical protein
MRTAATAFATATASTVARGTAFEEQAVEYLARACGMRLKRCGQAGDAGVDFRGDAPPLPGAAVRGQVRACLCPRSTQLCARSHTHTQTHTITHTHSHTLTLSQWHNLWVVQCKRIAGKVPSRDIREFCGTLVREQQQLPAPANSRTLGIFVAAAG